MEALNLKIEVKRNGSGQVSERNKCHFDMENENPIPNHKSYWVGEKSVREFIIMCISSQNFRHQIKFLYTQIFNPIYLKKY